MPILATASSCLSTFILRYPNPLCQVLHPWRKQALLLIGISCQAAIMKKISTSLNPCGCHLQSPPHTVTAHLCHSCHTFIPTPSLPTSQFENSSQPFLPTSTKFYLEQTLLCARKCEHALYEQEKLPPTNGVPTPAVLTLHMPTSVNFVTAHAVDRTGLVHESTNERVSSSEQENQTPLS